MNKIVNKILNILNQVLEIIFPENEKIKILDTQNYIDYFKNNFKIQKIKPENISGIENINKINIFYFYSYKDREVKNIIWNLKYRKDKKSLEIICQSFEKFFEIINLNQKQDLVLISIPSSKKRKSQRGFNQIELISSKILKKNNNIEYYPENIIRIKHTEKQSWQNKKERFENMQNAFQIINPKIYKNKNLIIIDDIYTTGATIQNILKEIKTTEPKNILVVVFSH